MSSRPLIAVNGLVDSGESPKLSLAMNYAESVRRAGGIPLAIPPFDAGDERALAELLERADGVLLSGGDDFDMERLGRGPTHPSATCTPGPKQDFDFALARACLEEDVPVLGICYGMQLLAAAEGCSLLQHLPEDRPDAGEHRGGVVHQVRIARGSKLGALLGVHELSVISSHHQALGGTAGRWSVAATDEHGLIEAVERAGHPFALGVQWHPERSPSDTPHARLFDALVEAARRRTRQHAAV